MISRSWFELEVIAWKVAHDGVTYREVGVDPGATGRVAVSVEDSQDQCCLLSRVTREGILSLNPVGQVQGQVRACVPFQVEIRLDGRENELRYVTAVILAIPPGPRKYRARFFLTQRPSVQCRWVKQRCEVRV